VRYDLHYINSCRTSELQRSQFLTNELVIGRPQKPFV
jgi:hypothetical protein